MPTTRVTLTKHFQDSGESNGRAWTRNDFLTADGQRFKTFDADIATEAKRLLNQQVAIQYEIKENGQRVNWMIQEITPIGGAAPVARVEGHPTTPADDRQVQINRSAGLARAIEFCSVASIPVVEELDSGGLFQLANTFARFFETGEFGASTPSSEDAVTEGVS